MTWGGSVGIWEWLFPPPTLAESIVGKILERYWKFNRYIYSPSYSDLTWQTKEVINCMSPSSTHRGESYKPPLYRAMVWSIVLHGRQITKFPTLIDSQTFFLYLWETLN